MLRCTILLDTLQKVFSGCLDSLGPTGCSKHAGEVLQARPDLDRSVSSREATMAKTT